MRVIVLGGTRFLGLAIAEDLIDHGHEVMVIHRGVSEPPEMARARHVHVERRYVETRRRELHSFRPDACVDVTAMTRVDAEVASSVIPRGTRCIAISSCDVYRAYVSYRSGVVSDCIPLTEEAPLRAPALLKDRVPGISDYEKLDVEDVWSRRRATILRVCSVFGPRDYLRRESFVIDRVVAGRTRMPFGTGNLLYSRVSCRDVGRAVRAVLEAKSSVDGEVFNVAHPVTASVQLWAEQIAHFAGVRMQFVRVPDSCLPEDLRVTGDYRQHVVISPAKLMSMTDWRPTVYGAGVRESVDWHLSVARASVLRSFDEDEGVLRRFGGS